MTTRQVNLFIAYLLIFSAIFALNAIFQAKPTRLLFRFVQSVVYPANVLRHTLYKLSEAIVLVFNASEQQALVKIGDVTFEQSNTVLGWRGNYLIATGQARVDDVAIDATNNRFVGIVRYVSDHVCWIEPWDSALFSMQVSVESTQVTIEGELLGGTRLKIYENIDVTGFTVRVSENFTNGNLLREMNCDRLGTVVGRQGDLFLVKIDPVRPTRLCYLPGY
jgi:hypothetical protein